MKSYEEMLKEAEKKLPKNSDKKRRLEIPRPKVLIQGNRTFITNFDEIIAVLRRKPKHFAKFLFRELAKPGHIEGKRLILQGKVDSKLLEKKLRDYCKEFLYCKECNKPDTKLVRQGRIILMVCEACGSRKAVRNI
jgi:translation initiation factor 2 subunit 2